MRPRKKTLRLRGAVLLCLFSGALLALSFPTAGRQSPAGLWPLAWVALVPWLIALRLSTGWGAALGSWAGGFAFYGVLLYWLWLFGWTVWAMACVALSLTLVLWGVFVRWTNRLSPGSRVLGAAVLWLPIDRVVALGGRQVALGEPIELLGRQLALGARADE